MGETACADIIIGVDTHEQVHAAVAIDALGTRLGMMTVPVGQWKGLPDTRDLGAVPGSDPGLRRRGDRVLRRWSVPLPA
jgi:hypothetical protein